MAKNAGTSLAQQLTALHANARTLQKRELADLTAELFQQWYKQAESVLEEALGPDWRDMIFWEGYTVSGTWSDYKRRLALSLEHLRIGELLLPGDVLKAGTEPDQVKTDLRAFIVHGHDNHLKLELKNYLQNTLGFLPPIILHEQPNYGRTIMEKFEDYADPSTYAFILLTPDDEATTPAGETQYRARQNVILEMGYFLGRFGRTSGRVILLYKGELEIPSDISGVVYISIANGIEAAGEKIRKELRSGGRDFPPPTEVKK